VVTPGPASSPGPPGGGMKAVELESFGTTTGLTGYMLALDTSGGGVWLLEGCSDARAGERRIVVKRECGTKNAFLSPECMTSIAKLMIMVQGFTSVHSGQLRNDLTWFCLVVVRRQRGRHQPLTSFSLLTPGLPDFLPPFGSISAKSIHSATMIAVAIPARASRLRRVEGCGGSPSAIQREARGRRRPIY
jgi:hypothetical protein